MHASTTNRLLRLLATWLLAAAASSSAAELPRASNEHAEPFDAGVAVTARGLVLSSGAAATAVSVSANDGARPKAVINPQSLSGLWFNPAQEGQGVSLTFQPQPSGTVVGVGWFVFRNGAQFYLTGGGPLVGNRIAIEVFSTTGAQFPPAFRSADVQRIRWGTLTLDVRSCTQITMEWTPSVAGFSTGSLDLQPLLLATGAPCQVTPDGGGGGGGGGTTDDHGDSCAAASVVALPGSAAGRIDPAADRDVFRFVLGASTNVSLRSTAAAGLDPVGTLYDAACNPIAESDDDPATASLNFRIERTLSAGTYFLGVRSFQAASTGSYSLALGGASSPPPGNQVVVVVNNALIRPINVRVNGTAIGQAAGGAALTRTVTVNGPLAVEFDLVRAQTNQGTPVGETMAGFFNPISNPSGTITFNVDNVLGSTAYFTPLITNATGTNLLMGVNMGLQSENRCNCVAAPGTGATTIGYYRLFSNSNVRAYRDGSGYTGAYVYWGVDASGTTTPLPQIAEPRSGVVRLTASRAP